MKEMLGQHQLQTGTATATIEIAQNADGTFAAKIDIAVKGRPQVPFSVFAGTVIAHGIAEMVARTGVPKQNWPGLIDQIAQESIEVAKGSVDSLVAGFRGSTGARA